MTRTHLAKARNIPHNPCVAMVVPLKRQLSWSLPSASIQIQGEVEILPWDDASGTAIFRAFWLGRRIWSKYHLSLARGETRVCFLKITPAPAIHTYMVDRNIWEICRYVESGAATSVMQHHGESR